MSELETNIFRIVNLSELSSTYRTYRVVNLHKDQEDYYANCQHLIRKLSFALRSPVAIVDAKGEPILVVKQDAPEPPKDIVLVRTQVLLEPCTDQVVLDYTVRSPDNDAICLRFLSFLVQNPLRNHMNLWQPGPGKAFFERQPCRQGKNLDMFRGYSIRPVIAANGQMGLCVDVHSKVISRRPLPQNIDRQTFQKWKRAHCIYHFGLKWYEVVLAEFSALNVSQHRFAQNGQTIALYDYIINKSEKPLPKEISDLPKDSSVVIYSDNRDDRKAAAAALCYPVVGNDDPYAQQEFPSLSILPHVRRQLIHAFVEKHLRHLNFGESELRVDTKSMVAAQKIFIVPDLMFGCSKILSTRATAGAVQVSLDNLGRKRMSLLKDKNIGFYVSSPLDQHYFFMPQSVHETFGPRFLKSLCNMMDDLFPQAQTYAPRVLVYPDREARTFIQIGEAILKVAQAQCQRGGYALVMIPEKTKRHPREEDPSAAYVIQQLRERSDIYASVIHTTMGFNVYQAHTTHEGRTVYEPRLQMEGRFNGYLRNVSINKILLLNQKWPFVLASPLHADAIVGIDVKGNMAGFVATNKNGNLIIPLHKKSQQKEKLMPKQCHDYFLDVITKLVRQTGNPVKDIAIHRDGRFYDTEIKGITLALTPLAKEGVVTSNAQITFIEIPKSSPVALRLFDISITGNGQSYVQNPQVGNHYVLSASDGYVCTTGRAFEHKGTVHPLHVVKVAGPMSIEHCLEDVFALSNLAWTRPEDCSRDPITIKLNDRWLGEDSAGVQTEVEKEQLEEVEI